MTEDEIFIESLIKELKLNEADSLYLYTELHSYLGLTKLY